MRICLEYTRFWIILINPAEHLIRPLANLFPTVKMWEILNLFFCLELCSSCAGLLRATWDSWELCVSVHRPGNRKPKRRRCFPPACCLPPADVLFFTLLPLFRNSLPVGSVCKVLITQIPPAGTIPRDEREEQRLIWYAGQAAPRNYTIISAAWIKWIKPSIHIFRFQLLILARAAAGTSYSSRQYWARSWSASWVGHQFPWGWIKLVVKWWWEVL